MTAGRMDGPRPWREVSRGLALAAVMGAAAFSAAAQGAAGGSASSPSTGAAPKSTLPATPPSKSPTTAPIASPATAPATALKAPAPKPPGRAASGPPSPGPSAALESAALQRTHDAALRRLEAAVQDRLDANKGQGRLRWREAVLPPDGDYLVWSPRTARSAKRQETYRMAIEIRTRWFYVARVERGQKPVFIGPLEEGKRGSFSEVLKAQR